MNARVQTKVQFFGVMVLLACAPLVAAPWSLEYCDPSGEPGWKAFEHSMRVANPGSTVYVPVPFPTTQEQFVQDYLYQYRSILKGLPAGNPYEPRVISDLASGQVRYEVLRIENWTVSRCRADQKRDYYNLLRVFEPDGTEVTRAVINDSGLMTTWNNLPASVPGPVPSQSRTLPPAAVAMAQLNSELGFNGTDPEYVAAGGMIDCHLTHPCLAFRQAGFSYIVYSSDQIFEVSAGGPRLTFGKEVGSRAEEATRRWLAPNERLVSLGGKRFTIGRQVGPAMIRSKKSAFAR
ncbi:MAG TPA: hypothetical protein VMW75_18880 [Thermoanaerobaculia bacterium]|nr:hypothetical protein [Thermoanaerobaculia bacterium]